jgi:acyl phosphate:glycerol-3-phosphate acyltransferase
VLADYRLLWLPVAAYLLGSIPFGLLVARFHGRRDPRAAGSGNIGATNVARVAGMGAGVVTLLLDVGKGMLSVWLAARFSDGSATCMILAGLAALIGHCFPIWLRFRGGKGVATAAGVFAVLCPLALVAAMAVWILVAVFWRYVSLASIAAAAALPLLVYVLWAPGLAPPYVVSIGTLAAAALIIWKHHANLQRLVAGEEPRFTWNRKNENGSGV